MKTSIPNVRLVLPTKELNVELNEGSDQIYSAAMDGPLTPESELLSEESDSAPYSDHDDSFLPFYATSLLNLLQHHNVITFSLSKSALTSPVIRTVLN